MASRSSSRIHYGYLVLFACCAICFSSVTLSFNTMGIFYAPASAEIGVTTGQFGTIITVQYLTMALTMIVAGKIMHRFSSRVVLSACTGMISLGLIAMSTFTELWQFYLAAVFIGAANSILLYLMVPTMIDRWFKTRVGFFVGLALAFTGIGAIVFNALGGVIIANFGWRTCYLVFGLISACVGFPCALFLIRSFPSDKGLLKCGETEEEALAEQQDTSVLTSGATFSQALRMPALYLVALYAAMMDVGITLNYYLPSYVGSLGYEIIIAATVASAVQAGQLVGKLLLGYINDRSVKMGVATAVTAGIVGIGMITFLGGIHIAVIYIGAFLFGIFFAGATVTTSLMTRGIFGSKDYTRIFSVVATVATLGSAISSSFWGMLIDTTGSYFTMLCVGLGMMVVTYLIGFMAFKTGDSAKRRIAEAEAKSEN